MKHIRFCCRRSDLSPLWLGWPVPVMTGVVLKLIRRDKLSASCDFTVCIIRCVYRAELLLGRQFTYRIPVLQYQFIKVRLRYINVPRTPMDSGQLQVGSARASHFWDAETCEFPSLSIRALVSVISCVDTHHFCRFTHHIRRRCVNLRIDNDVVIFTWRTPRRGQTRTTLHMIQSLLSKMST